MGVKYFLHMFEQIQHVFHGLSACPADWPEALWGARVIIMPKGQGKSEINLGLVGDFQDCLPKEEM